MKKWRNKILSAVLTLSLLLTSTSFAFAVGEGGTTDYGTKIEPSDISLEGSSRTGSGSVTNAFDGNTNTTWESAWDGNGSTLDESRFITLDLGSWTYLSHLTFIPRKSPATGNDQYNGTPKYLYIYTSNMTTDTEGDYNDENYNWTLAKIVDWSDLQDYVTHWNDNVAGREEVHADKEIYFNNNISTRYIKLYAPETYSAGDETLYITDLTFYKNTAISNTNVPTITTQPQSQEVNKLTEASLTVNANNASSYQWYKTPDGTLDSGIAVDSGISNTYNPTEEGYYFVKVTATDGSYVFSNVVEISLYEAQIKGTKNKGTLSEMIAQASAGQTIEILTDIDLNTTITIDKNLTIESVGDTPHTIKRINSDDSNMFIVNANCSFTLDNIVLDGGAVWSNDSSISTATNNGCYGFSLINIKAGSELVIEPGAILQNNESKGSAGGAIKADNNSTSTIRVYGKILNNRATYVNEKGKIWNNGGGIATDGKLYIYEGAVISGNCAPRASADTAKAGGTGGGIQIFRTTGELYVYGGTINNNFAGNCNNISFANNSTNPMELSGNFNIENINLNSISNPISIVGNVATSSSITIINNSIADGTEVATIADGVDKANIVNAIKVADKTTYISGNSVKVGQKAAFAENGNLASSKTVMKNPDGTASTTLTVATTGTDVTYKWYKYDTENGQYELISNESGETLNLTNLTTGSTYYCVIDNGEVSSNEPKQSTTCEVKVSDFYPCSQAIDKFKSI